MARYALLLLLTTVFVASCGGGTPKAPAQSSVTAEAAVGAGAADQIEIISTSGKKIGPQVIIDAQFKAKTAIELSGFWVAFKEPEGEEREVYVEGPVAAGGTFKAELRMSRTDIPAKFQIIEIRKTPKLVD